MSRIGSKPWMIGTLGVGDTIKMGNKDIEVSTRDDPMLTTDRLYITKRRLSLWEILH